MPMLHLIYNLISQPAAQRCALNLSSFFNVPFLARYSFSYFLQRTWFVLILLRAASQKRQYLTRVHRVVLVHTGRRYLCRALVGLPLN